MYFNPFLHEFYFCRFLKYNLRQTPIVYRLINAALIGNFFHDPYLFQNWNLGQTSFVDDAMNKWVNNVFILLLILVKQFCIKIFEQNPCYDIFIWEYIWRNTISETFVLCITLIWNRKINTKISLSIILKFHWNTFSYWNYVLKVCTLSFMH